MTNKINITEKQLPVIYLFSALERFFKFWRLWEQFLYVKKTIMVSQMLPVGGVKKEKSTEIAHTSTQRASKKPLKINQMHILFHYNNMPRHQ